MRDMLPNTPDWGGRCWPVQRTWTELRAFDTSEQEGEPDCEKTALHETLDRGSSDIDRCHDLGCSQIRIAHRTVTSLALFTQHKTDSSRCNARGTKTLMQTNPVHAEVESLALGPHQHLFQCSTNFKAMLDNARRTSLKKLP